MSSFLNAAFYRFVPWPEYREFRQPLLRQCQELGLKGTLLVAPEGLNGSICGPEAGVRELIGCLKKMPEFAELEVKESWSDSQSFARMKVRLKRQIITMGTGADPLERTGMRLQPEELRSWLDEGRDFLLVDTRNRYEISHGTFRGAMDLELDHFGEFPEKIEAIREKSNGRPVVMFCTGGIRCEKATAIALQAGGGDVFQLDGGILKYFERCGDRHYEGGCFVFDERVVVHPLALALALASGPEAC